MTWLGRLLRKARVEADLDRELSDHIERHVSDLVASGTDEAEARRRARLEFGGIEATKEECRDARGTRLVDDFLQDLRYGLRSLRKSPGFTLVAAASLALGIGANTAIFGVVNRLLLSSLPYPDSDRLVYLRPGTPESESGLPTLPAVAAAWREASSFEGVEAYEFRSMLAYDERGARVVRGYRITPGLPALLGVAPALGRGFTAADAEPGPEVRHHVHPAAVGRGAQLLARVVVARGSSDQLSTAVADPEEQPVGKMEETEAEVRGGAGLLQLLRRPPGGHQEVGLCSPVVGEQARPRGIDVADAAPAVPVTDHPRVCLRHAGTHQRGDQDEERTAGAATSHPGRRQR